MVHGGRQEAGLRPGTENVAGAVGLGTAVRLAAAETAATAEHTTALRDRLEAGIGRSFPDARVHAAEGLRAPHISMVAFPGADGESLLMHLDMEGIACSSGSACTTGSIAPSHVLTALGVDPELAACSVRFSFGSHNTPSDVDRVVAVLPPIVDKVRALTASLQ